MAKPKSQINTYDEELAKFASAVVAEKSAAVGTQNNVSLKAGIINVGGTNYGTAAPVIVLADVALNTYYRGSFDPVNPEGPVCFAIAANADTAMAPAPQAVQPQHTSCLGCPRNEYGSAVRQDGTAGAGKACKNNQRLIVVIGKYEGTKIVMPDLDTAPLWQVSLPPTSVRNWAAFCVGTGQLLKRPPFGVIARMFTTPDARSQFKVDFSVDRNVTAEEYAMIKPRLEEARNAAQVPFITVLREPAAQAPGKKGAPAAKKKYT